MTLTLDPRVIYESAIRGDRWYPYATQFLIPEANTQVAIKARVFALHSMAGPGMTSLENISRYYARDDIHTESTFGLAMDGRCAQFVPVDVRADCQAYANSFAASVETQDKGSATLASTPWTQEQVEQLAGISAWMSLNPRCALPLQRVGVWNGSGVDYHSKFSQWSIYQGKTCPGAARIGQVPQVLERAGVLASYRPQVVTPETPPVVTPNPIPSGPAWVQTPSREDRNSMSANIVIEYGEAKDGLETAPWYHALKLGPRGIEHIGGVTKNLLLGAGASHVSVDRVTPGAGDSFIIGLIEDNGTFGPSPYYPGSTVPNDALHTAWLRKSSGGL